MKARRKVPAFRTDRDAADYWAKHDSAASRTLFASTSGRLRVGSASC